jgi:tetratricopeptide (TPR) repeat protein
LGIGRILVWGGLLLWAGLLLGQPGSVRAAEQAEVEYDKGVLEYSNRNYLDALDHLRKAVELEPNNPDAQFYLGLTLTRLGEFPEAIAALEKTLQLDASKQYAHYHLGLAYFLDKRYQEALRQFSLAEQFDPQKAATHFYLGQTLYQLKRFSKAPPSFQRALELDPSLAPTAQYHRGLALYAAERDAEAQDAFGAAVRSAPETPLAHQAQRYLDALAQRAREQRLVQLQGTLGFEYDDNVILEPNAIEISGQADGRTIFSLVGRLLPVRTPLWRLGVEYALFQSLHFDLNDFDIQSHTGGVFARLRLDRVTFHAAANYNYTLLDNSRFVEAFTVQPSATIKQSERLFAVVSMRYRTSNFFDDILAPQDPAVRERDGWTIRVGAHQYWLFNQQRSAVRLSYHYEVSRNDGTDWEYDGHEIGLGLQTPLWWGVTLNVEGTYSRLDYLHVNSFHAEPLALLTPADTRARLDDRLTGAVALIRPLGRFLTLTASYVHTSNLSNIAFFDYRRNIWTLALTGRY